MRMKTMRFRGMFLSMLLGGALIVTACTKTTTIIPTETVPASESLTKTVEVQELRETTDAIEAMDATIEAIEENGIGNNSQIRFPEGDIDEFWDEFYWEDLTAAEQEAWGILGWDEESWDEGTNTPESDEASWDELTPAEQLAASALGYTQETWDNGMSEE